MRKSIDAMEVAVEDAVCIHPSLFGKWCAILQVCNSFLHTSISITRHYTA